MSEPGMVACACSPLIQEAEGWDIWNTELPSSMGTSRKDTEAPLVCSQESAASPKSNPEQDWLNAG